MDIQDPTLFTAATGWRAVINKHGGYSQQGLPQPEQRCWPNQTAFLRLSLGQAGTDTVLRLISMRGSASGQTQQPVQSRWAWEIGGYVQRPTTPSETRLDGGWAWMRMDGLFGEPSRRQHRWQVSRHGADRLRVTSMLLSFASAVAYGPSRTTVAWGASACAHVLEQTCMQRGRCRVND